MEHLNSKTDSLQARALSNKIKKCVLCEDLVKTRTQPVTGYGDFKADVFIIGEAPGRLGADMTGVPFTKDRSGVFLQKMLCGLGLNKSTPESTAPELCKVYITNIVKCNPRSTDGTNRPPRPVEISNCMNYLQGELDIVKPKLVVPLGLFASKFVIGNNFDGKNFGKLTKKQKFSVLPLWHPAFVIRGGGSQKMNEKRYLRHFAKIKKFIDNN